MKSWIRIIVVIFVLIGGAASFGYWSYNQFNSTFDNLSTAYLAVNSSIYSSFKQSRELASTSPEISGAFAISTATSTDPALAFTFPQKGNRVYIGCTYLISWQSSTTISLLETALIDAGTRESSGPVASGLAKENAIEKDSQNLKWKVGSVWPGEYYIKVSKINDVEAEFRSGVFAIGTMPAGLSASERENLCKAS